MRVKLEMLVMKLESGEAEDHGLNNPVGSGSNQLVAALIIERNCLVATPTLTSR